ncbi:MAG: metallophosphoesterase [Cyanobacteria bacterium PR.3.49]|nr:metallophosphoesterase [Cyanobacteria bacterium PR.3.49]
MIRKLGAIGDIHAEDSLLEQSLQYLHSLVDEIVCVGDIVDGPGDTNRCCDLLKSHNVHVISGNHERWMLNNEMRMLPGSNNKSQLRPELVDWLQQLPATKEIKTVGGKLLLCHGLGKNDMALLRPDDQGYALTSNMALEEILYESKARYVVSGHTHQRMVRKIDSVTFVNAGTLVKQQNPCFCIIDFDTKIVQFFNLETGEIVPGEVQTLP